MVANNLSPTATSPTNVLVARFSALGDVCMAIPVVYGVCRANPDVRVVFVTNRQSLDCLLILLKTSWW